MNHALISNHSSRSIYVNPLNYLELRLDFLPSPLYRKDGLLPYKEAGLLLHKKGLVEAYVDVLKVKSGRVQLVVSLTTLLMPSLMAFFCKTSLTPLLPDGKSAYL